MKDTGPASRMWRLYKMGGITPAITSVFDAKNAQQMAFIRSLMKEQRQQALFELDLGQMEAVVFDLETTGFSPYNGDEIISIGAIEVKGMEVKESSIYYSPVNPRRTIPDDIVRLTGITNEQAADAPELIQGLRGFLEFVGKRVLIAHGSGHDKPFLNAALWRTSKVNMTHRILDTMMIAKWLHPKRPSYDLDSLLAEYDVPVTSRHHALEDSIMTAKLWVRMLERVKDQGVHSLGDLYSKLSLQS